jgi:hypothetical protein
MFRWLVSSAALLIVAGSVTACGTSSPASEQTEDHASELVVLDGSSCVTLLAGQTLVAGTVCAEIAGDDLGVTYATSGDWKLYEAHL